MPGTGALAKDEKWVVTIEIEGARTTEQSNKIRDDLNRLVNRLNQPKKKASWKGKNKPK